MRIKNLILLLVVLVLSTFSSIYVGYEYSKFFPIITGLGGFIVPEDIYHIVYGMPLAYLFFSPFIFTAFGDKNKYWWIGLSILPAVGFELYFDFRHFYLPVAIVALGLLIGYAFSTVLSRYTYLAKSN